VDASRLVLDRPAGTSHPRLPSLVYPLDYGYLEGTRSDDGEGVDVWIGSQPARKVTAVICTVDLSQRIVELKILLGCTRREARDVLRTHNVGSQSAVLVERNLGHSLASRTSGGSEEGIS
jgi:inorganic pyrophosphatase